MVAPIVGPLIESFTLRPSTWPSSPTQANGLYDVYKRYREKWKQKRPYDRALPFAIDEEKVERFSTIANYQATNGTGNTAAKTKPFHHNSSEVVELSQFAQADAVKRFNGKLKEAAAWAVSFAERKQALQMMEGRLFQLVRFTRALRQGRLGDAAKYIISKHDSAGWEMYRRKRKEGRLKPGSKFFANNYLEFHFGWSPAVSDIYNTVAILQGGVPPCYVTASGKSERKLTFAAGNTSSTHVPKVRCKVGAFVAVTNPNLWLANQLGLVNPAVVALELVPFSFIADWFLNLSEFLGQFTEYWGLKVVSPWYQFSCVDVVEWQYASQFTFTAGRQRRMSMTRTVGSLPAVSLMIRKPWRLSPRRGAAAASLLVQLLK